MKITKIILGLALLLGFMVLPGAPIKAGGLQTQWQDMVTGVDAAGNIITSRVFGYYVSLEGGGQAFIEVDPATGKETGNAYIPGVKVGDQQEQILVGYDYVPDDSVTHKLFAPEDWHGPLWRGDVRLARYYSGTQPFTILSPYNYIPDYWRWMVFEVYNPNPWPVEAKVWPNSTSNTTDVTLNAYETKQLLYRFMDDPGYSPWSLILGAQVGMNYDPIAPTSPVDYVHNPPADDGTGPVWTARFYQGVRVSMSPDHANWSKGLWTLVPAFKEIPRWNPTSPDGKWGYLTYDTVPAWAWVPQQINFTAINGLNYAQLADFPGKPQLLAGYYGTPTKTPPVGVPSLPPYTRYQVGMYSPVYGSDGHGQFTLDPNKSWQDQWNAYLNQYFPGRIPVGGGHPIYSPTGGYFFTDATHTRLVGWYKSVYVPNVIAWDVYQTNSDPFASTWLIDSNPALPPSLGGGYYVSFSDWQNAPMDGSFYYCQNSPGIMVLRKDGDYYTPLYGSYLEVLSADRTTATYRYHIAVYNPGKYPVTFQLQGGKYYSGWSPFSVPAAAEGTVTINPYQTVFLTGTFTLPQDGYPNGNKAPEWIPGSGDYQGSNNFGPGALAPMNPSYFVWNYTARVTTDNVVGLDYGNTYGFHSDVITVGPGYNGTGSVGLNGVWLDYENVMTPGELSNFLSSHVDYSTRDKVWQVLGGGNPSFTLQAYPLWDSSDNGWRQALSLQP
ncbi:hypothetical protein [Neomoorella thermoacetica]|uniref:hypothetical protein n=1 Tax=Neomoorella thermoacetica TaxID=1525 RepID=UPI0008FB442E|nr:hypothetical protein [Moorella thermoacetica]OIQ53432.1 hypothetical protein MORE_21600 [Moorella thermoacetica]